MRVFIKGFGRIGRTILRQILLSHSDIHVSGINNIAGLEQCAYLFRYDSVYGPFSAQVLDNGQSLTVTDRTIPFMNQADISEFDLSDVVLECTGHAQTRAIAERGLVAGAKRVLISGPSNAADKTLVLGANEHEFAGEQTISNASCTTNAIAPLLCALNESNGIAQAHISTMHCYTRSQPIVDAPRPSFERSRAAAVSMIPTTTGAAGQITHILPQLKERLSVSAIRVPCKSVSANDAVIQFETAIDPDVTTLCNLRPEIISVRNDPCVSSDFRSRPESLILSSLETKKVGASLFGASLFRFFGWYDNEWGFSARMIEMSRLIVSTDAYADPPPLKWSSGMFRKTEEDHGQQAPKARRDCHQATAG